MSKLIVFLSLIGLSILFTLGLIAPDSSVMWLASTSTNFALLRAVLMFVLLVLLLTNPPRNVYMRVMIGMFSLALMAWSLDSTYNNHMKLVDTLSLLPVSIVAGLDILEQDIKEVLPYPRYEIDFSHKYLMKSRP